MTSYTDEQGNKHVILRDGRHYVARGSNYTVYYPAQK